MKWHLSPRSRGPIGRHARYLLVSACLSAANPAVGAINRDIELTDGSHLVGEIVAVDQGTYTVKSERLGVVRLKDADIVAIRAPGAAPPKLPLPADVSPKFAEGMAMIQQKILGNPELLQSVKALAGDPEIQSLLKDPDLMKSVLGGNPEGLQNKSQDSETDRQSVRTVHCTALGARRESRRWRTLNVVWAASQTWESGSPRAIVGTGQVAKAASRV